MTTETDLMTTKEVAERLRCSLFTVDKLIKTGRLKPLAITNRVIRIPRAQVEAFFAEAMEVA